MLLLLPLLLPLPLPLLQLLLFLLLLLSSYGSICLLRPHTQDVLVLKAVSRRVCSGCGKGYNVADIRNGDIQMPPLLPKKPNVCDKASAPPLRFARSISRRAPPHHIRVRIPHSCIHVRGR